MDCCLTALGPSPLVMWTLHGECAAPKGHFLAVTVKTFGLLLDQAWIWLDFPDLKHDYINEVYWFNVCFAGRGPRTCDFHGDCFGPRFLSQGCIFGKNSSAKGIFSIANVRVYFWWKPFKIGILGLNYPSVFFHIRAPRATGAIIAVFKMWLYPF